MAGQTSADAEIKKDLCKLIDRCRDLERNDPYMRRYLKLLENNVLGAHGIGLQMKITDPGGTFDDNANGIVENGWYDWGTAEHCTVSKRYCWAEIERLALRRTAADGSLIIRKHVVPGSKYGFAVEPYEIDHIDFNYNLAGRNQIRMGIEYDENMRVSAFHFLTTHPGDVSVSNVSRQRVRIPVGEILHVFMPERPGQTHGFPWFASVMLPLKMLHGYSEAEITAARAAACIGMAITTSPDGYQGQTDANGNTLQEMTPGAIYRLNAGEAVAGINPTHPNSIYPDFTKAKLREISAGIGVSYNSLANDLENVNYSSIRAGLLEEREEYKRVQLWLIESLHRPVFSEWLKMALLSGAIAFADKPLPVSKFDKFNRPEWKPRRWPWVDPLKDLQSHVLSIEKGITSRRTVISELGGDIEDVFKEQAADKLLEEENGLDFDAADSKEMANKTEETPRKPDKVDTDD